MQSLFGLAGKRVLVIGGGQGMGEASALLLASLGASIAILDIDGARAEAVRAKVEDMGVAAFVVTADVTDETQLVAAIAHCESEFGPLYGLVTIIGMAGWSPIVEMTSETWDRDHDRNLRYVFIAAREFARSRLARGEPGAIVSVASVDGIRSARHHASYGAAKAGLVNLVKTMAAEWTEKGIRVNCVAPGGIVTPRIPLGDPDKERAGMALVPMGRRGSVDDIAKAVAFFLSDMSPYVSGQTLAVDGGYLAAGGFSLATQAPLQGTIGLDDGTR